MATDAIHPIAPHVRHARSSRFTDRMSACKGLFDRGETPMSGHEALPACANNVTELPVKAVGRQAAHAGGESFLQMYMKAFAAARE